jgi:hypothetical protein
MNWQKRARLGVAIFGIASAVGVYAVMGDRAKPARDAARASIRRPSSGQGNVRQVRGTKLDYLIEARQQLPTRGATRLIDVKVTMRNRGGRDSSSPRARRERARAERSPPERRREACCQRRLHHCH